MGKIDRRTFNGATYRKGKSYSKIYGIDCICLWEHELREPEKVAEKVRRFIEN